MAELIAMPKLSDTMTVGTLVKWLKKEGDKVASGDMLCEVETDKATMEVENFANGVLLKHYVPAGGQVPVGAAICAIGKAGEKAPEVKVKGPEATKATEATEGKKGAEAVAAAGAQRATANGKAAAGAGGLAAKDSAGSRTATKEAAPKAAGATSTGTATTPVEKLETQNPKPETGATSGDGRVKASPLAKKIAALRGISLAGLAGTGPGGRIVQADVLAAASKPAKGESAGTKVAMFAPSSGPLGEDATLPVSNMRAAIARRLVESKTQIPHFYVETEVDAGPLVALREGLNAALADVPASQGGGKLTVNDFVLKAAVEALRRVPAVNASWAGETVQRHGRVHLAFGVALEDGLITPVIREADGKSLRQLSAEAKAMAGRARAKKLKPDEMTGSTFTVTNLGMFGVTGFFGIINPPNAAILSVGATVKKPVVDAQNRVVAGQRMAIGLSGDHRVIDGAVAAQYLQALKALLETPALLLL